MATKKGSGDVFPYLAEQMALWLEAAFWRRLVEILSETGEPLKISLEPETRNVYAVGADREVMWSPVDESVKMIFG